MHAKEKNCNPEHQTHTIAGAIHVLRSSDQTSFTILHISNVRLKISKHVSLLEEDQTILLEAKVSTVSSEAPLGTGSPDKRTLLSSFRSQKTTHNIICIV